jgi:hypothetical protein
MVVPIEYQEGKEHHLSRFDDLNLSSLANKLANTPQTLNIIICDYLMKNNEENFLDCNSEVVKQPTNPGLSLIYHCRNNENELSFYIR